ncbi:MAG: hypothetical protein ACPGTO_08295 [Polaribacter sp.]
MIHYIKRKDLDIEKYDSCIENAIQSSIYAFSWYLDIAADHWDVLVFDDYKAVMPIPWRKKFFINYVYPPFWVLELGIFSVHQEVNIEEFLDALTSKFKFVELRTNTKNKFNLPNKKLIKKEMQFLLLENDYKNTWNSYRKDRKKDLQKATKNDLTEKWNDIPENLIQLFKNNVGKRTPNIKEKDYDILLKLINTCLQKKVGEILSVYDKQNRLVASGFFLKNKNKVSILVSSTDFKNRKNGANTFLIDRAIYKYQNSFEVFHFGGSSIKTVARYFLSFGAKTEEYGQIKHNELPAFIKIFKR